MDEYLTTQELCSRIKMAPQTLYNKKSQGEFTVGRHFLQPSRKKTIWIWSGMKEWLERSYPEKPHQADEKSSEQPTGGGEEHQQSISKSEARQQNPKATPVRRSVINI